MKNRLKKMSAAVMALFVLVTTVACGKNKILEQTDIIAEQCGLEETDDIDRVLKDVAGTQDYTEQVYLKADGAEAAQPVYDVLDNGYIVKNSILAEKLDKLSRDDRDRIYDVIDTMAKHATQGKP